MRRDPAVSSALRAPTTHLGGSVIESTLPVREAFPRWADAPAADHAHDVRELCQRWLTLEGAALQHVVESGAGFPPSGWPRSRSLEWPERHTERHLALVAGAEDHLRQALAAALIELEPHLRSVELDDQVDLLLIARRARDARACTALLARHVAEVEAVLTGAKGL